MLARFRVPVLALIPYAILTTYGVSTTPLSHSVTFGNTFLKMFAAPLMSALLPVPSAWRYRPLLTLYPEKVTGVLCRSPFFSFSFFCPFSFPYTGILSPARKSAFEV